MKLEARISMLINPENTEIEIQDYDANTTLAKIILTPEELSKLLARHGYLKCECTVGSLDHIGKKHENKTFEFEITSKDDLALQCEKALFGNVMDDWEADNYYNSQNSFFEKDGKKYARTIIRRWISK